MPEWVEEVECDCLARGARLIDWPDGGKLIEHLSDCGWLAWLRSTGGCQGDEESADA